MSKDTLKRLAGDAAFAVSDLMDEEQYENFLSMPEVEQVRYRYLHADCDDFALILSLALGWTIYNVSTSSRGPLHRLVVSPEGLLLDASGWTSPEMLAERYGVSHSELTLTNTMGESWSLLEEDEYEDVILAALHLDVSPFTTGLRAALVNFHRTLEDSE